MLLTLKMAEVVYADASAIPRAGELFIASGQARRATHGHDYCPLSVRSHARDLALGEQARRRPTPGHTSRECTELDHSLATLRGASRSATEHTSTPRLIEIRRRPAGASRTKSALNRLCLLYTKPWEGDKKWPT